MLSFILAALMLLVDFFDYSHAIRHKFSRRMAVSRRQTDDSGAISWNLVFQSPVVAGVLVAIAGLGGVEVEGVEVEVVVVVVVVGRVVGSSRY